MTNMAFKMFAFKKSSAASIDMMICIWGGVPKRVLFAWVYMGFIMIYYYFGYLLQIILIPNCVSSHEKTFTKSPVSRKLC